MMEEKQIMEEMKKNQSFLKEYKELCRKYGLTKGCDCLMYGPVIEGFDEKRLDSEIEAMLDLEEKFLRGEE
jgi:hypothetical protein